MTRGAMIGTALAGVALGALGMLGAQRLGGVAAPERAATERIVRAYLLDHPEIIPEAMARLQQREAGRQVAQYGAAVTTPYAGAWEGNPNGDVTVVEYFDYNCGYCRASLPVIEQLIAADRNVRVVYRELPILAPSSRVAARASLAAAEAGKYGAFHRALYAAGPVTDATIAAALRRAGVPAPAPARAKAAEAEIDRNIETAAKLGVTGTPSWVIGDQVLAGALPLAELEKAVAAARAR